MRAQAVNANNLANTGTSGFRADIALFRDAPVTGPGFASRNYTRLLGEGVDASVGTVVTTGRDLDIAINGVGWIAVQARDGGEAYSRRGDLRINSAGLLTDGIDRPILGDGGPIALPPHANIEIAADGTVSILPVGQNPEAMAVVGRIKLVNLNPAELVKDEQGDIRLANGAIAPADAAVGLVSGSLEMSNVNAVGAMVRMIELSRSFELQVNMMNTAAENDRASAEIMRTT